MSATPQAELLEAPAAVLVRATLALPMLLSLGAGSEVLFNGPASERVMSAALMIALFWRAAAWTTAAATWLGRSHRRAVNENRALPGSRNAIGFLVSAAVWTLGLLLTLENPDINSFVQMGIQFASPTGGFDAPQSGDA